VAAASRDAQRVAREVFACHGTAVMGPRTLVSMFMDATMQGFCTPGVVRLIQQMKPRSTHNVFERKGNILPHMSSVPPPAKSCCEGSPSSMKSACAAAAAAASASFCFLRCLTCSCKSKRGALRVAQPQRDIAAHQKRLHPPMMLSSRVMSTL